MTNGSIIIRNVFRFVFLVLLQVLILNNIQFLGFINPYLYILFIMLLPFRISKWALLCSGFLLGLIIDFFSNTGGLHCASAVFLAFLRPAILKTIASNIDYDDLTEPNVFDLGIKWFLLYSVLMTLTHHSFLFVLEIFRLSEFFYTFVKIVFSSVFTIILVFVSQYFFYKHKT